MSANTTPNTSKPPSSAQRDEEKAKQAFLDLIRVSPDSELVDAAQLFLGNIAFDAWKSYRQLLYAGVMEVVRIKKEGFPFRQTYVPATSRPIREGVGVVGV